MTTALERVSPMRSFDPRRIGELECRTWVTYYRHEWRAFLVAAVLVVRAGFRLPWAKTLWGAWLVLRANQLWAPLEGNDPDGARRCMRRFYAMVATVHGERLDVDEAARLEVEWWRVHRELQHERRGGEQTPLVDAIAALYAHVYAVPTDDVRDAARLRAEAMDVSDRWVDDGRDLASPLVAHEEQLLVRSYAALLAAVHRPAA